MTTIKIQRTREYNNMLRNYDLFIDGQPVGTIANGEVKEFPISAGQHIIEAKIDWCGSPEVSVSILDNETKTLKVGGFKNGNWLMSWGIAIIVLHFILLFTIDFHYTLFLLAPTILLIVYYVTLGRKKYLTLEELGQN